MRDRTCDEYCRRLIVAPVRNKRVDDGSLEDDIASLGKLSELFVSTCNPTLEYCNEESMVVPETHKIVPADSDTQCRVDSGIERKHRSTSQMRRINLHTSRQSDESAIQREQCHHLQLLNVVSRYTLSEVRDISLTALCDCKDDRSPEQEGNQQAERSRRDACTNGDEQSAERL